MQTVLNQKPNYLLNGGLAFLMEERRGGEAMRKKLIYLLFIMILFLPFEAFSLTKYEIIDLGGLDPSHVETYAHAINDSGHVTGISKKLHACCGYENHPFLWINGQMQDLYPYETSSYGSNATDINNNDQIVGEIPTTNGPIPPGHTYNNHAFIWDEINGINDLGILGGYFSGALGINNSGQVVGVTNVDGGSSRAFIWDETNEMQDLLGVISRAEAINDSGVVVGQAADIPDAAFIWDEANGVREIVSIGSGNADPFDINNSGQVVGRYWPDERAFIWDETNGMQDIGTLAEGITLARSINDLGQVVGSSRIDNVWHAFLYQNGSMDDLNDLIPEGSGWVLEHAQDINNNGQIVGIGFLNGNDNHGFLLTPISYELVSIDVIPKTCPNEYPIKGGGSIEVAILGTVDFDVNDIDIASVRLEGVAPTRSSLKDKSSPVVPPPTNCECTSEGKDGFFDLCLKFDKKEILSALGEVNVGDIFVLTLSGSLNDGTPIEGQDCIVMTQKGKKN